MRMIKPLLSCLLFFVGLSVFGEEEENLPHYLLVAPEGMEEAPVDRVRNWMASNLHYEVRLLRLPSWEGESSGEQAEALNALPAENVIATVVMAETLEEGKHAVLIPDRRLGLIHVPLLYQEASETHLRRLDRQAIRIVGFSLGVPPQPMPFCALAPYQTVEELDRIGRGLSPPAMAQYRRQLIENGFPLSPDAERLLPDVRVRMPDPAAPESEQTDHTDKVDAP